MNQKDLLEVVRRKGWEIEAFLETIVENVPYMVFVKDAQDLTFVRFNKAGEDLIGLRREDLIGKSDFDFFPKEQAEFFTQKDREVLNGKKLVDIPEEPLNTARGTRILHTKKIPILDEQGVPQFLLGLSVDITERKKMTEQLLEAKKMEAIVTLASGIAHEFNNIHTTIAMATEIIKDLSKERKVVQSCVDDILKASLQAGTLTAQLMAFARQEHLAARPSEIDLNEIVKEQEGLLRTVLDTKIDLKIELSPALQIIRADRKEIAQILFNLAENARDAMPDGGSVLIRVATAKADDIRKINPLAKNPDGYVELSIGDTGVGLDEKAKKHLFEPFFTTKSRATGTGLGLAAAYGIVMRYGGHVLVDSELGAGALFRIFLPKMEAFVTLPRTREEVPAHVGTATILLVDDEAGVLRSTRRLLEYAGFKVHAAEGPEQALEIAARLHGEIDLLLTDLIMPFMNGRDLATRLLAADPRLKVLFMSGYTNVEELAEDEFMKDQPFLAKPCDADTLVKKLREVLARPTLKTRD